MKNRVITFTLYALIFLTPTSYFLVKAELAPLAAYINASSLNVSISPIIFSDGSYLSSSSLQIENSSLQKKLIENRKMKEDFWDAPLITAYFAHAARFANFADEKRAYYFTKYELCRRLGLILNEKIDKITILDRTQQEVVCGL